MLSFLLQPLQCCQINRQSKTKKSEKVSHLNYHKSECCAIKGGINGINIVNTQKIYYNLIMYYVLRRRCITLSEVRKFFSTQGQEL